MEATPNMSPTGPRAGAPAVAIDAGSRMQILFAILMGLFLAALDQTIVGTALPRVVGDLGGNNELYTWVVTIYLLTSTITGPFYGKLSDLYGRKPMLLFGVTLFLIGSALSGLSWNIETLILFRGIQGIGAGALFPIALAVIGDLFTPQERGKYQGLFGAVFGIAAIVGPLLGGFLTDALSWHWIFYVNLPIGAVALYIIWRLLPTLKRPDATRNLDYLGAAVFTVAISLLLIGLTNKGIIDPATGAAYDWTTFQVGGLIALSLLGGALFLAVEARAKEPIIPLGLFRNRTYSVTMLAVFLASFGFFGAIIFLPRWFQFVKGVSPTESGLQTLALLVGLIASSVISGQVISRTGRYKWLIVGSLVVMSVGLLLSTGLHASTELPVLWVWMFVTGVGIGPTLAAFTIVIQNAVPFQQLGVATSNMTFFRQIGGSVGLAIAGTIFGTAFVSQLAPQLQNAGIPAPLAARFASQAAGFTQVTGDGAPLGEVLAGVPALAPFGDLIPAIVSGIHEAFSLAVASTFWFGLAAGAIATLVALALPELPLRAAVGAPSAPPGRPTADAPAHGGGAVPARSLEEASAAE